jgi:cytochrome c biogenesis protein CcmG/thiol:disulfide interchange protein DsbE
MISRPKSDVSRSSHAVLVAAVAAILLAALPGCGEDGDPGAADPESRATDYQAALTDAPPRLAALYRQGNELIEGGPEAFEAQLDELRGFPAVVNKWASWCGPCRFEFPFLQELAAERGAEVAFLGINSKDGADAARTFLERFPVPYPSFADPDHEIGDVLEGAREFPVTAFYDSDGELAFVHRGVYASKEDLAADIDRYAR